MGERAEKLPAAAPIVIVGVCGESVDAVIGGVRVTFMCQASEAEPAEPAEPTSAVEIVRPIVLEPPTTALIVADDPELLAPIEVDMSAEPLVLNIDRGGEIVLGDFADTLSSAQAEGRQVQLHVSDVELGG